MLCRFEVSQNRDLWFTLSPQRSLLVLWLFSEIPIPILKFPIFNHLVIIILLIIHNIIKPADNNGRGFVHIYMGVATICLQTVIYVSGRGFVHTYTLMNGRGYHMSTGCNLRKWA